MASLWRKIFGGDGAAGPSSRERGTRAEGLQVVDVIDGDTLRVELNGGEESLRLICLDTEESQSGGSKPVTRAGKLASEMAKEYFREGDGWCKVDIEFESSAPLEECLEQQRGNYGRLICYVYRGDDNYNLHTVREGYSPYFVKYGRARFFHNEFLAAEQEAQANRKMIWDPSTNEGGASRDYEKLMPWWTSRGSIVEDFRREALGKALDIRVDYDRILEAMKGGEEVTLFCDLQGGFLWAEQGAVIHIGTKSNPFSLWFPGLDKDKKTPIVCLVEERYASYGRGYVYMTGKVTAFKEKPQLVIENASAFADFVR